MKFRLRVTLLTILLTLLSVTVLIIGITWQFSSRENADDLTRQLMDQTSQRISERLANVVDATIDQGQLDRELLQIDQLDPTDFPRLTAYWLQVMRVRPEITNIYLTLAGDGTSLMVRRLRDGSLDVQIYRLDPKSGKMQVTTTHEDQYMHPAHLMQEQAHIFDPRKRPWYSGALAAGRGKYSWTKTYLFVDEGQPSTPGVSLSTALYQKDRLEGVLGIDIDFHELCKFLSELNVSQNGFACVLERRGGGNLLLIAHPHQEFLVETEQLRHGGDRRVEAFMAGLTEADIASTRDELCSFHFVSEGSHFLGGFRPLTDVPERNGTMRDRPDWIIGIIIPEDDVLGRVHRNARWTVMIAVLIFAIAGITAVLVAGQVASPLEVIQGETRRVAELDLSARPPVHSLVLEVDQLGRAVEKMKSNLRSFKKYIPEDLARQLIRSGEEASLGGERRVVTVGFSDIVGFTTISEQLSPETLVEQLREFLSAMSNEIIGSGGTVDKYIGDAVMAFWGAPHWTERHAAQACISAVRSQARLRELRAQWLADGRPPFHERIGLNSGEVVVGNIGSEARLNYTVIGDAVNLASRLEGLNKIYGTEILISETTYEIAQPTAVARPIDWVAVKGKSQGVLVYELLGLHGEAPDAALELVELHREAFQLYMQRDWERAGKRFEEVQNRRPGDRPAELMIARCQKLRTDPPGPGWDGIQHIDTK